MNYEMKLNPTAFKGVKEGKQKWETRLYTERRREISVGDTITFSKLPDLKDKVRVKVTEIVPAKDFMDLFTKFDPKEANWPKEYSIKDCADSMLRYYSVEDQKEHGVVGFKIEVIK